MKSKVVEKPRVLFIIGEGHSGSTILDTVLNSHSQIFGVGEVYALARTVKTGEQCCCGEPVESCEFWSKVIEKVEPNKLPMPGQSFSMLLKNSDTYRCRDLESGEMRELDNDEYVNEVVKLYDVIQEETGCSLIVDSSKEPDRVELLIQSGKIDATLLHLVRDGRGVTYSHIKLGRPAFRHAKKWFSRNIRTEIVKRRNNVPDYFLRYKTFAKHPKRTVRSLLHIFDIPFEEKMVEDFKAYEHHQIAGNNNVKFKLTESKIKFDEKWREKLGFIPRIYFSILSPFGWLNAFYKLKGTDKSLKE